MDVEMPRYRRSTTWAPVLETDLLDTRGLTLAQVEEAAIRASFARHGKHQRCMMQELGIAKTTLLRKLDLLGLRKPRIYLHGKP